MDAERLDYEKKKKERTGGPSGLKMVGNVKIKIGLIFMVLWVINQCRLNLVHDALYL